MNHAGVRIIAVGDPDQSIYGFTGAKPGLLRTLETFPNVEAIRLKLNYRCADQIIAASKTLLPHPGEFQSHDGRQGKILIYELECDVRGQADYALGLLFRHCSNKTHPGNLAISPCSTERSTKESRSPKPQMPWASNIFG